jgi:hypothetical protein
MVEKDKGESESANKKPQYALVHATPKSKVYMVDFNSIYISQTLYQIHNNSIQRYFSKDSALTIYRGSVDALEFIVEYLDFYKEVPDQVVDIKEIPAPEIPLPENVNLVELFEYEPVFSKLTHGDFPQNKKFINDIINIAEELKMPILIDKISAIIAYYMIYNQ